MPACARSQRDLGWWLIKAFEAAGLATNIKTPDDLAPRPGSRRVDGVGNADAVAAT